MAAYSIALFSAGLTLLAVTAQRPIADVLPATSRSVVRVSCARENTATGFLWRQPQYVVTALHVVAGCTNVVVYSQELKRGSAAQIVKALKGADLALLELKDTLQLPVLEPASDVPQRLDALIALGYGLGAPTMHNISLKLAFGVGVLGEMLPTKAAQQVRAAGMPDLTLRILRLEGHLIPGFSGAPVLDRNGKLVAIGDGGLENGAVGVSWAIPVDQLTLLEQSQEPIARSTANVAALFAAEFYARAGETLSCGSMTFTKVRTASAEELIKSSDNPRGTELLTTVTRLMTDRVGTRNRPPLAFDIYSHLETGATFAVPEWVSLRSVGGDCAATNDRYGLRVNVSGTWRANKATALDFLNRNMIGTPYSWKSVDQYTPPRRWDSMELVYNVWNGFTMRTPGAETWAAQALAVTLARNNSFLGVFVLGANPEMFDQARGAFCGLNSRAPGCPEHIDGMVEYWSWTLGAYFSTYPIG